MNFGTYAHLPSLSIPAAPSFIRLGYPNGAFIVFYVGETKPNVVKYGNGDMIIIEDGKVTKVLPYYRTELKPEDAGHIPLEECVVGNLYRVKARGFKLAIFMEKGIANKNQPRYFPRFVGVKTKFNWKYLQAQYHWDHGKQPEGGFATCKPLEDLGPLDGDFELTEFGNESLTAEMMRLIKANT